MNKRATMLPRLVLAPVSVERHPVVVDPEFGLTAADGLPVYGTIGMDVIGEGPFTLDVRAATLTLHNPARSKPPEGVPHYSLRPLADAGAKDANGFTAFDHALKNGSVEAVKLLGR